jgi:broad specificity phosphatase PhoE
MELIIYRHAQPMVSANNVISGRDFPLWVQRYNASGIGNADFASVKEEIVYTSDLPRSKDTGSIIGKAIITCPLLKEAEIPLIRLPGMRLKAKWWLVIARILWLLGYHARCESLWDTKKRVKAAVDFFESQRSRHQRMVVVGHGFINRMIGKELLRRGWSRKQPRRGHGYLSKMIFEL